MRWWWTTTLDGGLGLALVFWFLGSALLGWLYDVSLPVMVGLAVVLQIAAIPFLVGVARRGRR